MCILFRSSIMYSGYAWIRSSVITPWCLDRHSIATGGLAQCCTLQILHMVTLRMIPTYLQVCETLCCDMSCTSACFLVTCFCYAVFLLQTFTSDDGMDLSLEALHGFSLMMPSGKRTWRTGNFSKMGIISTPSMILHRTYSCCRFDKGTKTGEQRRYRQA